MTGLTLMWFRLVLSIRLATSKDKSDLVCIF